ncbi:MAG: hypothetical protein D3925_06145, partial [Candidatus Electrothrix sp. AR5]|nr:hypothetical protein [Candidatus Electrothrix sp. AR5]
KLRNSFQSEIRFAEPRTAAAYSFLIASFFRIRMPESCSEDAETLLSAIDLRQENSEAYCELKQRRM